MGTLTAGQQRLPGQCEHKLPTSCRLTSISNCCACADERAHAASYRTYIDGIGFVPRGTRWQRYCWFCKEFWERRVEISGLRSGQTRIPQVPDQTEFLERWYEFHQGYRVVKKDDGTEERIALLGEDFRDVSPGYLPRTLDELRAGRQSNDAPQVRAEQVVQEEQQNGPSLEETLDQLFQAASVEESVQRSRGIENIAQSGSTATNQSQAVSDSHIQTVASNASRNQEYQNRRIAALRRELLRMRGGIERVISGLRELGEEVPDHTDLSTRLVGLGDTSNTVAGGLSQEEAQGVIDSVNELTDRLGTSQTDRLLVNTQARVEQARNHLEDARRNRDHVASELDQAEAHFRSSRERFQQLQREQRTMENYMRTFGTREDMAEQGENYVSPIGNMFSRAYERFHAAEDVRREERTLRQTLFDETRSGSEEQMMLLGALETAGRDVWGVPTPLLPARNLPGGGQAERLRAELREHSQHRSAGDEGRNSTGANEHTESVDRLSSSPNMLSTAGESRVSPLEDYNSLLVRQSAVDDARADSRGFSNGEPPFGRQRPLPGLLREWLDPRREDTEPVRRRLRFMINSLHQNDLWREEFAPDITTAGMDELALSFERNEITDAQVRIMEPWMGNELLHWRCGLPLFEAWIFRLLRHPGPSKLASAHSWWQYVGLMALAYQIAPSVRAASPQSESERLETLQRLKVGQRPDEDLAIICRMLDDDVAWNLAEAALSEYTPLEWMRLDARYMLAAITANDSLREDLHLTRSYIGLCKQLLDWEESGKILDIAREYIDEFSRWVGNNDLIWRVDLPREWATRRKQYINHGGSGILFEESAFDMTDEHERERADRVNPILKIELAREAYTKTTAVRLRAGIGTPPERLQLLYRLQRGELSNEDKAVLTIIYDADPALILGSVDMETSREQNISAQNIRETAIDGEGGLDPAPRHVDRTDQSVRDVAIAASRQAMRTGPHVIYEELAHHGEETREVYRRLRANGFIPTRPSERGTTLYRPLDETVFPREPLTASGSDQSDNDDLEDDESIPRGLDDAESGRPDPKSEEELQLSMDCKVCYTQIAEIACIPCGHLVMCRWCSDQHSPTLLHDRTRPARPALCPVCRKRIRNKYRVFRA